MAHPVGRSVCRSLLWRSPGHLKRKHMFSSHSLRYLRLRCSCEWKCKHPHTSLDLEAQFLLLIGEVSGYGSNSCYCDPTNNTNNCTGSTVCNRTTHTRSVVSVCVYMVTRVFWVVARELLGSSGWLLGS